MKLSIIIPVYNEEKTIIQLIKNVEEAKITDVIKEIIIVNDCSTDSSTEKIKDYIKGKPIKCINQQKNQGKGAAIQIGIREATGDYIIIQDADLEYDPKLIVNLIKPILENQVQVVYGTRLKRLPHFNKEEKHHLFLLHYFGNRFLSLITSILYGQWITDMETCYKIFPTAVAKSLVLHSKSFDFEPEITAKLMKKGYKIVEISITTVPRGYEEGKKLHAIKDGRIALWTLIKYRFTD